MSTYNRMVTFVLLAAMQVALAATVRAQGSTIAILALLAGIGVVLGDVFARRPSARTVVTTVAMYLALGVCIWLIAFDVL